MKNYNSPLGIMKWKDFSANLPRKGDGGGSSKKKKKAPKDPNDLGGGLFKTPKSGTPSDDAYYTKDGKGYSYYDELKGESYDSLEKLQEAQKNVRGAREVGTQAEQYTQGVGGDYGQAYEQASSKLADLNLELQQLQQGDQENPQVKKLVEQKQEEINKAALEAQTLDAAINSQNYGQNKATMSQFYRDPASMVKTANVGNISTDPSQFINQNAGQLTGNAPAAQAGQAGQAATATAANKTQANTYQSQDVTPEMKAQLDQQSAAQGQVSPESLMQAAQQNPELLKQLGLSIEQIEEAVKVISPDAREVQSGEMIEGSAVDMDRVNAASEVDTATADPTTQATVQGQLEGLMQDFEGGDTPAWAAGAMRQATAKMAQRGLASSSMAGQAIIQATMESALPIAMADAKTFAQFEAQNLSNRQQSAMFAAQQRAQFLGMEFNQEFQARVANAAKISDIANMNFSAEQQIALENAKMAQTVDLQNLSHKNAKIMADAAAMTQMEMANLNNRQQAQVQNAQNFLQMDMQNLSNQQQMQMFKSQSLAQSLLSDQAAENAAKQFNAASQNQTDQFFADMSARVSQFNADQKNAIEMFNAGERGATERFNAQQQAARDQFNAQNHLIVQQANAQWRQSIASAEFEAQQQANMEYASTANAFTTKALDELWQKERDLMSLAWQSSENAQERAMNLLIADKQGDVRRDLLDKELDAADEAAKGGMAYNVLFGGGGSGGDGLIGGLFG